MYRFLPAAALAAMLAGATLWPAGCGGASDEPSDAVSSPGLAAAPVSPSVTAPARLGVRVPLTVRETAGIGRAGEVVQSGIPLPRSLGARDPRAFAVLGPDGRAVPADFRVLARWNAGLADGEAAIQWLLAAFPASVASGKSAVYTLVTDGSVANPPPPSPLALRREGDRILVDTGAAVFRLGGDPGALFDEVRRSDGARLISGGEMTLAAQGRGAGHPATRRVRIEHAGPLSAVVVVEGAYGLPPVGGGGFGSTRRYVFTAGSPAAIVRHAVAWEGNLACQGCIARKDGSPNGVRLERVRDALALAVGDARQVAIVGDREAAALTGAVPAGQEAWLRQRLRPRRDRPLRFEVSAAGRRAEGEKADGGLLAVSGPAGTVAAAIRQLHRYEPQALRLLADGSLALDLVDDQAWLAHHQGLFATVAIAALPPAAGADAARADLDRLVWAPLNRPLRAWPDAAWFAGSAAAGEVPAGPLRGELAAYDKVVPEVLEQTVRQIDEEGIAGLLTFGVFPRYWGRWGSPEIQCKGDPTPAERWDDVFWCGTWADYHNTLSTAPLWAMRGGGVEWLDELGFPGALRTLHTQIMQCAPGDSWFYCGQAPAGYGGYRADFNSSHAYFENLFLYYWLTGDSTVVETLRRGGESMRRRMCGSRGPREVTEVSGPAGPACAPGVPLAKASFTGRVAYQWLAAFRFLGLASEDASFLEDWRSGLARAVTHQYVEVERDGRRYGFLGKGSVDGTRAYTAGPMWMNAFYDAENLYRLQLDTGDAPIGEPPLPPSRVLAALARSMVDLEARVKGKGKGKVRDEWPQSLGFTWEGGRLGGRLVALEAKGRNLYGPEKAGMAALLVRAGRQTGDRELLAAGEEVVGFILGSSKGERAPLGKLQGQYLTRLHAAVAGLASPP